MKAKIALPLLALVSVLLPSSCSRPVIDRDAVRESVSRQLEVFPESRLQDLYKSFFQDRFGPGHIISDRGSSLDYIRYELATADTLCGPEVEPCGWQGNYVRVNLSLVARGLISADELADALMESGKEVREEDVQRWVGEWNAILSVVEKEFPDIPGLQEDKEKIDSLLSSGEYAWHHSEAYSTSYHPHYRILLKDVAGELLDR